MPWLISAGFSAYTRFHIPKRLPVRHMSTI